ncbi:MAG TPA: hypothetical protein VNK26_04405 [Pyrinomonadaceae bacterium]|nr:hypothetical protein [Pyrinomonadaceae bacterium]
MKKLEILVNKPKARKIPPRNSDKAAAQAKNFGAGKFNAVTPATNCSLGGSFMMPCPKARAIPAKILNKVRPILPVADNPCSPENKIFLNIKNPLRVYFDEKEWHNFC